MDRALEEYIVQKHWQWKLVEGGRQVRINDPCPFCGKEKHLYFASVTTKWDCKRCGESGNLLTLKRRLGDLEVDIKPAHQYIFFRGARDTAPRLPGERPTKGADKKFCARLFSGKENSTLEYLKDVRGFSEETLKHYNIGIAGTKTANMISIPHYYRGELVCIKFRSIPPAEKSFARWKDCPSVLFNSDSLNGIRDLPANERIVHVCEGEFDAIALAQYGYKFVVSSTIGAGVSEWPVQWLEALEPATTIFLWYDADSAGEEGAERAAAALGIHRCRRVVPPLHDTAEALAAGIPRSDMDQALRHSRAYGDEVVIGPMSLAGRLRDQLIRGEGRGRSTGWMSLDIILGGIRDGEVTVVTGDTGSGKSTWTTALARHQAKQGVPTLIIPFEQPCEDILGKLVSMEAGKSIYDFDIAELDNNLLKVASLPIYFVDQHGKTPLGILKDAIYVAAQHHGVKFIVLDHLHFFLESESNNERYMIDAAMQAISTWATDLKIHIVLVVHPKTLGRDKNGALLKVTLNDLKGSSEIKKLCWNGIRVHRNRKGNIGSSADDVEIAILKCRSPAGSEGATVFFFDDGAERYIETCKGHIGHIEEEEQEGWEGWNIPH